MHAPGTQAFSLSADGGHADVLSRHLAQVGLHAASPNPDPFCQPPRSILGFPGDFVTDKLKHILLLLSIDFMENKLPGPPVPLQKRLRSQYH